MQADLDPLLGSLVSVRRRSLRVAVSTEVHKQLLAAPAGTQTCLAFFLDRTCLSSQAVECVRCVRGFY